MNDEAASAEAPHVGDGNAGSLFSRSRSEYDKSNAVDDGSQAVLELLRLRLADEPEADEIEPARVQPVRTPGVSPSPPTVLPENPRPDPRLPMGGGSTARSGRPPAPDIGAQSPFAGEAVPPMQREAPVFGRTRPDHSSANPADKPSDIQGGGLGAPGSVSLPFLDSRGPDEAFGRASGRRSALDGLPYAADDDEPAPPPTPNPTVPPQRPPQADPSRPGRPSIAPRPNDTSRPAPQPGAPRPPSVGRPPLPTGTPRPPSAVRGRPEPRPMAPRPEMRPDAQPGPPRPVVRPEPSAIRDPYAPAADPYRDPYVPRADHQAPSPYGLPESSQPAPPTTPGDYPGRDAYVPPSAPQSLGTYESTLPPTARPQPSWPEPAVDPSAPTGYQRPPESVPVPAGLAAPTPFETAPAVDDAALGRFGAPSVSSIEPRATSEYSSEGYSPQREPEARPRLEMATERVTYQAPEIDTSALSAKGRIVGSRYCGVCGRFELQSLIGPDKVTRKTTVADYDIACTGGCGTITRPEPGDLATAGVSGHVWHPGYQAATLGSTLLWLVIILSVVFIGGMIALTLTASG